MGAEKIVKINSEHEVECLKERINLLESVIDYSLAETVQGLKNKVKDLENEAIALRAADAEKDKMITEKDKRIDTMQTSYETQLANKLEWQRKQFEAEKAQSLSDQRKNIRSKEVKPEKEKVEAANNERDRIKGMYEQLLNEHDITHKKLDTLTEKLDENTEKIGTITEYSLEILSVIKQSIVSGESSEKLIEKIDSGIEALNKRECRTKEELEEEDIQIIQMIKDGKSDTDIANIIYEHLSSIQSRRTQLSKRKKTKRFKKLYEELVGN